MTDLEREIRREILSSGPMPFERFMELALYHSQLGYYRRGRPPLGAEGDYFTNDQLQPVFGRLIARQIAAWREALGWPRDFTVVELGAGRGATADVIRAAIPEARYVAVEHGAGGLPERFIGVVFSNEFFDALPVRVYRATPQGLEERRVAAGAASFVWADGDASAAVVEVNDQAREWMARIARSLERGFVLTIDYGYTAAEIAAARFPQGSLMGYRRHAASADVLADPGGRDITAHVNFTALAEEGEKLGLRAGPLRTQAEFLLALGERDEFRESLAAPTEAEADRLRRQLKTLLFGLGETFRVLVQEK